MSRYSRIPQRTKYSVATQRNRSGNVRGQSQSLEAIPPSVADSYQQYLNDPNYIVERDAAGNISRVYEKPKSYLALRESDEDVSGGWRTSQSEYTPHEIRYEGGQPVREIYYDIMQSKSAKYKQEFQPYQSRIVDISAGQPTQEVSYGVHAKSKSAQPRWSSITSFTPEGAITQTRDIGILGMERRIAKADAAKQEQKQVTTGLPMAYFYNPQKKTKTYRVYPEGTTQATPPRGYYSISGEAYRAKGIDQAYKEYTKSEREQAIYSNKIEKEMSADWTKRATETMAKLPPTYPSESKPGVAVRYYLTPQGTTTVRATTETIPKEWKVITKSQYEGEPVTKKSIGFAALETSLTKPIKVSYQKERASYLKALSEYKQPEPISVGSQIAGIGAVKALEFVKGKKYSEADRQVMEQFAAGVIEKEVSKPANTKLGKGISKTFAWMSGVEKEEETKNVEFMKFYKPVTPQFAKLISPQTIPARAGYQTFIAPKLSQQARGDIAGFSQYASEVPLGFEKGVVRSIPKTWKGAAVTGEIVAGVSFGLGAIGATGAVGTGIAKVAGGAMLTTWLAPRAVSLATAPTGEAFGTTLGQTAGEAALFGSLYKPFAMAGGYAGMKAVRAIRTPRFKVWDLKETVSYPEVNEFERTITGKKSSKQLTDIWYTSGLNVKIGKNKMKFNIIDQPGLLGQYTEAYTQKVGRKNVYVSSKLEVNPFSMARSSISTYKETGKIINPEVELKSTLAHEFIHKSLAEGIGMKYFPKTSKSEMRTAKNELKALSKLNKPYYKDLGYTVPEITEEITADIGSMFITEKPSIRFSFKMIKGKIRSPTYITQYETWLKNQGMLNAGVEYKPIKERVTVGSLPAIENYPRSYQLEKGYGKKAPPITRIEAVVTKGRKWFNLKATSTNKRLAGSLTGVGKAKSIRYSFRQKLGKVPSSMKVIEFYKGKKVKEFEIAPSKSAFFSKVRLSKGARLTQNLKKEIPIESKHDYFKILGREGKRPVDEFSKTGALIPKELENKLIKFETFESDVPATVKRTWLFSKKRVSWGTGKQVKGLSVISGKVLKVSQKKLLQTAEAGFGTRTVKQDKLVMQAPIRPTIETSPLRNPPQEASRALIGEGLRISEVQPKLSVARKVNERLKFAFTYEERPLGFKDIMSGIKKIRIGKRGTGTSILDLVTKPSDIIAEQRLKSKLSSQFVTHPSKARLPRTTSRTQPLLAPETIKAMLKETPQKGYYKLSTETITKPVTITKPTLIQMPSTVQSPISIARTELKVKPMVMTAQVSRSRTLTRQRVVTNVISRTMTKQITRNALVQIPITRTITRTRTRMPTIVKLTTPVRPPVRVPPMLPSFKKGLPKLGMGIGIGKFKTSYAPTLIGLSLPKIKATSQLKEFTYSGALSIRPQVKAPDLFPKLKGRKLKRIRIKKIMRKRK